MFHRRAALPGGPSTTRAPTGPRAHERARGAHRAPRHIALYLAPVAAVMVAMKIAGRHTDETTALWEEPDA